MSVFCQKCEEILVEHDDPHSCYLEMWKKVIRMLNCMTKEIPQEPCETALRAAAHIAIPEEDQSWEPPS